MASYEDLGGQGGWWRIEAAVTFYSSMDSRWSCFCIVESDGMKVPWKVNGGSQGVSLKVFG